MYLNIELIYILLSYLIILSIFNRQDLYSLIIIIAYIILKLNIFNPNKLHNSTNINYFLGFLDTKNLFFIIIISFLFFYQVKSQNTPYQIKTLFNSYIIVWYLNIIYQKLINFNSLDNYLMTLSADYTPELINGLFFLHPLFFLATFLLIIIFIFNNSFLYSKNIYLKQKNKIVNISYYNYNYIINLFLVTIFSLISGAWWAQQELNWNGWWSWDNIELISFSIFIILYTYIHFILFYRKKKLIYLMLIAFFLTYLVILRFNLIITRHTFLVDLGNLQFSIYGLLTILFSIYYISGSIINKLTFLKLHNNRLSINNYPLLLINKYNKLYLLLLFLLLSYYNISTLVNYISYYYYIFLVIKFDYKGLFYISIILILLQFLNPISSYKIQTKTKFIFYLKKVTFKNLKILGYSKNTLYKVHLIVYIGILYCYITLNPLSLNPLFTFNFIFYEELNTSISSLYFKITKFYLNYSCGNISNISNLYSYKNNFLDYITLNSDSVNNQLSNSLFNRFTHISEYSLVNASVTLLNSSGLNIILVDLVIIFIIFLLLVLLLILLII